MTKPLTTSLLRPNTITARVFEIIAQATEEGLPAPANEDMADQLRSMNSNISDSLRALEEARLIQIEWEGRAPAPGTRPNPAWRRRFRILATGEVTAWTPHGLRRGKGKTRPCMICAAPFLSEGPHHRLCTSCNHWAASDGGHAGTRGEGKQLASHAPRARAPITLPRLRCLEAADAADPEDAWYGETLRKEMARRIEREDAR